MSRPIITLIGSQIKAAAAHDARSVTVNLNPDTKKITLTDKAAPKSRPSSTPTTASQNSPPVNKPHID